MSFRIIRWDQNMKKKYHTNTNSFIVYIKTEGIYVDIAKDVIKKVK